MTHKELVKKAKGWLRAKGCGVVITEMASNAGQEPDAIGWQRSFSILIECKASRSDYMKDKNKEHQRLGKSMGDKRYYLAPKGIIKPEELPEKWGLLEPYGNGVKRIRNSGWFDREKNCRGEAILLVSAIRRIKGVMPEGTSVKSYVIETNCRATIGISKEEGGFK